MGEILLAARPVAVICHIWKGLVDGAHSALGPFAPHFVSHICFDDGLYKTMDREYVLVRNALHQGETTQQFYWFVEAGFIFCQRLKCRSKFTCSCDNQCFRDGIRCEKCQEPENISSQCTVLLDLRKVER